MTTLRLFARSFESVPASTSWYLADLGEARGKQELYIRQSPQRLKALREHALIESAVSSNRIEGVEVDQSRIATIVFGKHLPRDRAEEEVRGYRQALTLIHEQGAKLPLSEETVLKLHRLTRGEIWDAGIYKEKDGDIVEKSPDGRTRVRFKTVPAADTPTRMRELLELYDNVVKEQRIPPLILLAAFNLDFLCIHIRFATATAAYRGSCCSCNATIWDSRSAGISASSASSSKTRNATTKPSSKAPTAGTKPNTIPGRISITPSSSSRPHIKSSSSASAEFKAQRARKQASSFTPST